MFPYNIASLMLEIFCLNYALNDPLGRKNPRDALKWTNRLKTGENEFLPTSVHMWGRACIRSFDFVYAGLTLHTWAANQRKP